MSTEKDLLEILILGVEDERIWLTENFLDKLTGNIGKFRS